MVDFSKYLKANKMATQVNQSEILSQLAKLNGVFDSVKNTSDPFSSIKLPIGDYIGHLIKGAVSLQNNQAKNGKVVVVTFTIVAKAQIGLDKSVEPPQEFVDTQYDGQQILHRRKLEATANQTLQDANARLAYDMQEFGFQTQNLILSGTPMPTLNPQTGQEELVQYTLLQALATICDPNNCFYIRFSVTAGKNNGKFLNFRGTMNNEDMEKYLGAGNFIPIPDVLSDSFPESDVMSNETIPDHEMADNVQYDAGAADGQTQHDPNRVPVDVAQYQLADGTPCDEFGNVLTQTDYVQYQEPVVQPVVQQPAVQPVQQQQVRGPVQQGGRPVQQPQSVNQAVQQRQGTQPVQQQQPARQPAQQVQQPTQQPAQGQPVRRTVPVQPGQVQQRR